MNAARLLFILILVVTSGCLAESYPGIVVGNPEVDEGTTTPGKSNDNPQDLFPGDVAHEPVPSQPPASGGDPSSPGSIDKEPDEPDTVEADQEIPGGDRVGQETDTVPPSSPSRPEHAEFQEDNVLATVVFAKSPQGSGDRREERPPVSYPASRP